MGLCGTGPVSWCSKEHPTCPGTLTPHRVLEQPPAKQLCGTKQAPSSLQQPFPSWIMVGDPVGPLLPPLHPQSTQGKLVAQAQHPITHPTTEQELIISTESQWSSSSAPQTPPSTLNGAFYIIFHQKVISCPKSPRKAQSMCSFPQPAGGWLCWRRDSSLQPWWEGEGWIPQPG